MAGGRIPRRSSFWSVPRMRGKKTPMRATTCCAVSPISNPPAGFRAGSCKISSTLSARSPASIHHSRRIGWQCPASRSSLIEASRDAIGEFHQLTDEMVLSLIRCRRESHIIDRTGRNAAKDHRFAATSCTRLIKSDGILAVVEGSAKNDGESAPG